MEEANKKKYLKVLGAGAKRNYWFEFKNTRSGDYYLTITERRRNLDNSGYATDKIFIYKEDILNVQNAINASSEFFMHFLMPDFKFENYLSKTYDAESDEISEVFVEHREQVLIFLPGRNIDLENAERITNACGKIMEALGYEVERQEEPIFGSFISRNWFKIKKKIGLVKKEVEDDFNKTKKALEKKYLDLPTAEQTEKLAAAAANLTKSLETEEEGIARLGAVIVLKKKIDGKSKTIILQLNDTLIALFNEKPQLLLNMETAYAVLTGETENNNLLEN